MTAVRLKGRVEAKYEGRAGSMTITTYAVGLDWPRDMLAGRHVTLMDDKPPTWILWPHYGYHVVHVEGRTITIDVDNCTAWYRVEDQDEYHVAAQLLGFEWREMERPR